MGKKHDATRMGGNKIQASKSPVIIRLTPFGVFAFHEGKEVKRKFWGKNPARCAEIYLNSEVDVKEIGSAVAIKARRVIEPIFGEELEKFAIRNGFDAEEFRKFFQEFSVEVTKLKLKFGFSKDKLIVQAIEQYDELTKMINMFYERLSEWYGFYYPEIIRTIKGPEEFSKIAGEKRKEKSIGYEIEEEDLKMIKVAGNEMATLISYREKLTNYIETLVKEVAPNLGKVAGFILGAKLISAAGSLKKLAELRASTIQLLGAEKALFRHLRQGTKPPKYGLTLQHSMMKNIPFNRRGRFARTLAGKISIAAKVDYHSHGKKVVWESILKSLESRVKGISK